MRKNPILEALDNPEEAAYQAERRQLRLRRYRQFLAILVALGISMSYVVWKAARHISAATSLRSSNFRVAWGMGGASWLTGGSTSVKHLVRYNQTPESAEYPSITEVLWLHRVEELDLSVAPKITSTDLEVIERLPNLLVLNLARLKPNVYGPGNPTRLNDAALSKIKGLKNLQVLILNGQAITDAGAAELAGLTRLDEIELKDTEITDAGLEHFKALPRLNSIDVTGSKVTDEGVAKFQAARPNVKIINDSPADLPITRPVYRK